MRRLVHAGALVVGVACGGSEFFVCNDDEDCAGTGEAGVCQSIGACAVPDDTCDSGLRYVEGSQPTISGECVPDGSGTGGEGSSGDQETSADDTGEASGCPDDWWDCAWAYRQRLQVARPYDVLTGVPVLVLLTAGRVDHELMQADGEDLRFVSATGAVAAYEVERWDPEGVSIIWVTVDALGGPADHLWMYYGNPVAEDAQDPGAVWAEPFAGVWHLEEDDEPRDASANGNDGVVDGNTSVVLGQIANGRNFGGGEPRMVVEPSRSLDDVFVGGGTVSAWIRPRGWGQNAFGRIANKSDDDSGWLLYVGDGGRLNFTVVWGVDLSADWATPTEELSLERWTHVAVSYDLLGRSLPRIFIDGVERPLDDPDVQPTIEMPVSDTDVSLIVGNRPNFDRDFYGFIDELRVEQVARGPEWIRLQHDSMRDDLLEYGPIETGGVP